MAGVQNRSLQISPQRNTEYAWLIHRHHHVRSLASSEQRSAKVLPRNRRSLPLHVSLHSLETILHAKFHRYPNARFTALTSRPHRQQRYHRRCAEPRCC